MSSQPDRSGNALSLIAMGVAVLVVANDFTAMSVALPAMEQDFGADVTTVQWVITGYALVFGTFIVTGGRLADLFGRKRTFFIGATIFAVASSIGGLAPNVAVLLGSRAVMAIGGAMMWPAILGMTYAILPAAKAGLAGAIVLGAAGFGNAMGPLLGGFLTDALSWRWIFFVNVPIAALAIGITWATVRVAEPEAPDRGLDYGGMATLTVALLLVLLALDEGAGLGWTDPMVLVMFAAGGLLLVAFALVERRMGTHALVPGDVMDNRAFASAVFVVLLLSAVFFAAVLYLPQFMQKELGYSAVRSGAGLLPVMATFAAVSFASGPVYARLGAKLIVTLGATCLSVGIFMLSFLEPSSSYTSLVPGMVVLGVGIGLFYSSITTAAVTALDPSRAALAGGIVYMFQIAGGSIGLGLNTALVATAPSLVEGIQRAFKVDAALALGGVVLALLLIGGRVSAERIRTLRWHHRAHA